MCHELVHDPIHFHPYMWGWSQYKEDYKLTIIGTISISRWYHVRSDKQDTRGCRKGHFSSKMCLDYEKRRWQLYWEDSCTSSRGPMRRTKCLNFALFASRILFFFVLSCLVLFLVFFIFLDNIVFTSFKGRGALKFEECVFYFICPWKTKKLAQRAIDSEGYCRADL